LSDDNPTDVLRGLLDDFDRILATARDQRQQMLRTVILELRIEVAKLERLCD
jgi:hypothetical protein